MMQLVLGLSLSNLPRKLRAIAFKYSVKGCRQEACPGSINSSLFTFDEESLLSYYKRTDHFEIGARRHQALDYHYKALGKFFMLRYKVNKIYWLENK